VKKAPPVTEADILSDVISPGRGDLTLDAAKSILSLNFSRSATSRIRSLLRANNRGALSAIERVELEKYLRVGQLIDLLQAKARLTLESRKAA
jgi:hypothetical protein